MNIILIVILILILIIAIVIIFLYEKYEYFNYTNSDNNYNNPYYAKIPNIFYTKQYINNLYMQTKPKTNSLESININSYMNSDITTNKRICSNINDQGKCWDNYNCQWIELIGDKSYCNIGPKLLL
jgi:hypothetical protein